MKTLDDPWWALHIDRILAFGPRRVGANMLMAQCPDFACVSLFGSRSEGTPFFADLFIGCVYTLRRCILRGS